jgi:tRNA U34 5-carboxymethylaminomethyl modifying enzyme MnmG/GidA
MGKVYWKQSNQTMNNLDNNLDKRLKNLEPIPFTKENQPSPEAKRKGWERRREAQQIADELMKIKDLSYAELEKMKDDVKLHPENYTVMQVKLMQYMSSSKLTVDWIDRHMSKAPQEIAMTGDMELKITREILNEPTSEVSEVSE